VLEIVNPDRGLDHSAALVGSGQRYQPSVPAWLEDDSVIAVSAMILPERRLIQDNTELADSNFD